LQRTASIAGALGMVPYQFVRIQPGAYPGRKCSVSLPWVEAT
jgi:hypothetical protein